MAAEPQDFEPEKLTAGVTWKWKKTHSDYPASEWTLTYYLRKDGATATSFTGTADEDSFLVTVAASTTSSYAAGVYDFIGVVSNEISYMQKHGARNRIMQKAIKSQTENLRRRTHQAIEAAARKAKMKA